MNPIQQAIEQATAARDWLPTICGELSGLDVPEDDANMRAAIAGLERVEGKIDAALTSLRSLNKEAEGVELPEAVAEVVTLPVNGGIGRAIRAVDPQWMVSSDGVKLYTADQLRTAIAAAQARGAWVAQVPVGYIHPQQIKRLEAGETVAFRAKPYDGEQQIAVYLATAPEAPAQADPCPGCIRGGVCKKPECGRLKLPTDHPLRTGEALTQPTQGEALSERDALLKLLADYDEAIVLSKADFQGFFKAANVGEVRLSGIHIMDAEHRLTGTLMKARAALATQQAVPEVPQGLLKAIRKVGFRVVLTGNGYELWSLDSPTVAAQQAVQGEPVAEERWWSPPDSFAKNWLTNGAALHPLTANLVVRFARALATKLAEAEVKYGYSDGWRSADWMDECRAKLAEHVAKGDPRDVAAYCAFLWHHGESTAAPPATGQVGPKPDDVDRLLREVFVLCEATEDAPEVEPKNEHQRGFDKGRRFEAKQIRRAIGEWFQSEFCGRSFMGEPAPATGQVERDREVVSKLLSAAEQARKWIRQELADKGVSEDRLDDPPQGSHLANLDAAIRAARSSEGGGRDH